MMAPDRDDPVYSVQLYGTDPEIMRKAVAIACGDHGVSHVDLNFGCPVPKVTRRGGGGVLPWKLDRFRHIVVAAVEAAEPFHVPVTVKTRLGIDDDHLYFLDAGRISQESGIAAITLHARTVEQAYSGAARWEAISELAQSVSIPVIGNGDIWEASDALAMMADTGCAGVSIGRGALGRPWLFRDLAMAMVHGQVGSATLPTSGEVAVMVRRHAELLVEHCGDERHGLTDLRKHMAWYFKGFSLGGHLRSDLALVSSFPQLDELLSHIAGDEPFPTHELNSPRGRQGSPRSKVTMPYGWLGTRDLAGCEILGDDKDAQGG
jgi:nifR3 family TIM-barrel protein